MYIICCFPPLCLPFQASCKMRDGGLSYIYSYLGLCKVQSKEYLHPSGSVMPCQWYSIFVDNLNFAVMVLVL